MLMDAFWSEVLGTAILLLLGGGVVATVLLPKSKGFDGGWLLINFGWGLAVFAGVYVAFKSGAHLNPAVTIGLFAAGEPFYTGADGATIDPTVAHMFTYFGAEMLGAFLGAVVMFLAFKKHFDEDADAGAKLAVFSTGPAIRSYGWNLLTEIIGTFVLVFWVVIQGKTPTQIGPLAVALIVVVIGTSLGGPTGYAINPARDLGPRIAHALLPIKGKGSSDWSYAWVPVVGPLIGGIIGGLVGAAYM
ncbi:MIP/aquaporin family protein [Sanguibacter sp. A247]|uniref:MIP/aquaporin family protein n=1 Tax=unclassified Sanguibacter TaxID=2645534 RepID=UPI003FD889FC